MKSFLFLMVLAPALAQTPALTESPAIRSAAAEPTRLPAAEQRLRVGIVMLQQLEQLLAGIDNEEKAATAVAPAMRLSRELRAWAQSFAELPPLSEAEQQAYEDAYLPIIRKLNNRIRTQGERLAAAKYYGSDDLTAALIHLALLNQ